MTKRSVWEVDIVDVDWHGDGAAAAQHVVEVIEALVARGVAAASAMDFLDAGFAMRRLRANGGARQLVSAGSISWSDGERLPHEPTHAFRLASGGKDLTFSLEMAAATEHASGWLTARLCLEVDDERAAADLDALLGIPSEVVDSLTSLVTACAPEWGVVLAPRSAAVNAWGKHPVASFATYLCSAWPRVDVSSAGASQPFQKGQLLVAYRLGTDSEPTAGDDATRRVQAAIDHAAKRRWPEPNVDALAMGLEVVPQAVVVTSLPRSLEPNLVLGSTAAMPSGPLQRAVPFESKPADPRRPRATQSLEPVAALGGTAPIRGAPTRSATPFDGRAPQPLAAAGSLEPHPQLGATASFDERAPLQDVPFPKAAQLTLEQFASMKAEVAMRPGDAAAIGQRYGLTGATFRTLEHQFEERFEQVPGERERFHHLLESYRAWLASRT